MKTAYFTMGGPGSGKSYILARDFSTTRVIDADSMKKLIAGYDPKNPEAVHLESSQMAMAEFLRTVATETADFIYDGTGANAEKIVHQIKQAQQMGWTTKVIYVRCSLKTALARNAKRERSVPEALVREKHATITDSFEIVGLYADETRVIENDAN